MNIISNKKHMLASSVALSVLAHLLLLYPITKFGKLNFSAPVNQPQTVMVNLEKLNEPALPADNSADQEDSDIENDGPDQKHVEAEEKSEEPPRANPVQGETGPKTENTNAPSQKLAADPPRPVEPGNAQTPAASRQRLIPPPLRTVGEFLATEREKLTYLVKLYGIPAGSAELEAINEKGELRITFRIKSDPAVSAVYPVDDVIETRLVNGNFVITKIKQQEGTFKSDKGFTIFLREKYVYWMDLLKNRVAQEPIPNNDVLDIISGFYLLRKRPLQIAKTESMHIFNGIAYEDVPVEVLRREPVWLPGFRKVDTLVVKPLLKNDGIFNITGDLLIWLTDDEYRVPVKVETQIALGSVTAELIAAESQKLDKAGAEKQFSSLPDSGKNNPL